MICTSPETQMHHCLQATIFLYWFVHSSALSSVHFIFLGTTRENTWKAMKVWECLLGLLIRRSICTYQLPYNIWWRICMSLVGGSASFSWYSICRHLGFLIGMNVSNVSLIYWISWRIEYKFMYWKSQAWPLHVGVKVVKSITYYLQLTMVYEGYLNSLATSIIFLCWRREEILGLGWVAWKHCVLQKDLAG